MISDHDIAIACCTWLMLFRGAASCLNMPWLGDLYSKDQLMEQQYVYSPHEQLKIKAHVQPEESS